MTETKETDNKTAAGRKTMSLNVKRTVEQGHIRQNFSHGRSKSVLVETKRKRVAVPGLTEEPQQRAEAAPAKPQPRVFQEPRAVPRYAPQKVLRASAGEMDARARALISRSRFSTSSRFLASTSARARAPSRRRRARAAPFDDAYRADRVQVFGIRGVAVSQAPAPLSLGFFGKPLDGDALALRLDKNGFRAAMAEVLADMALFHRPLYIQRHSLPSGCRLLSVSFVSAHSLPWRRGLFRIPCAIAAKTIDSLEECAGRPAIFNSRMYYIRASRRQANFGGCGAVFRGDVVFSRVKHRKLSVQLCFPAFCGVASMN